MAYNDFDFSFNLSLIEHTLTITLANTFYSNKVEKLLNEFTAMEVFKRWRSKYNSYVVYDYEPFCTEGFDVIYEIKTENISKLRFIERILTNSFKRVKQLEDLYKLNIDLRSKDGIKIKELNEV